MLRDMRFSAIGTPSDLSAIGRQSYQAGIPFQGCGRNMAVRSRPTLGA